MIYMVIYLGLSTAIDFEDDPRFLSVLLFRKYFYFHMDIYFEHVNKYIKIRSWNIIVFTQGM